MVGGHNTPFRESLISPLQTIRKRSFHVHIARIAEVLVFELLRRHPRHHLCLILNGKPQLEVIRDKDHERDANQSHGEFEWQLVVGAIVGLEGLDADDAGQVFSAVDGEDHGSLTGIERIGCEPGDFLVH